MPVAGDRDSRAGQVQPASVEGLVRRAREGDRDAVGKLLECYYERWLCQYHGQLGRSVRRLYETRDLIQSAVGEALEALPKLRNESAFYCWMTSIIRHKLAKTHRALHREKVLIVSPEDLAPQASASAPDGSSGAATAEEYIRVLDAFLDLFPRCPERMAAVYLKLLEDCSIEVIQQRLGQSRRTVFRWLKEGTALLRVRLER